MSHAVALGLCWANEGRDSIALYREVALQQAVLQHIKVNFGVAWDKGGEEL